MKEEIPFEALCLKPGSKTSSKKSGFLGMIGVRVDVILDFPLTRYIAVPALTVLIIVKFLQHYLTDCRFSKKSKFVGGHLDCVASMSSQIE